MEGGTQGVRTCRYRVRHCARMCLEQEQACAEASAGAGAEACSSLRAAHLQHAPHFRVCVAGQLRLRRGGPRHKVEHVEHAATPLAQATCKRRT